MRHAPLRHRFFMVLDHFDKILRKTSVANSLANFCESSVLSLSAKSATPLMAIDNQIAGVSEAKLNLTLVVPPFHLEVSI
jgi:hypothetical protein